MSSPFIRRNGVVINMSNYQKFKTKLRDRKSFDEIPKQRLSELSMCKNNHSMTYIFKIPQVSDILNNVNKVYEDSIKLVEKINTSKITKSIHYDKYLLKKFEKNNEVNTSQPESPRNLPFSLPEVSPIKKHKRYSSVNNSFKLSSTKKKSSLIELVPAFETDDIYTRFTKNKNQLEILNKKLYTENTKIDEIQIKNLTLAFKKEMPQYVKLKRLEKKNKYDYMTQLDNGQVFKEDVDNIYIPGSFIKENHRLVSTHPRYIKNKFTKLATEATEVLQKNITKIIK
jgi:hypothetical protein